MASQLAQSLAQEGLIVPPEAIPEDMGREITDIGRALARTPPTAQQDIAYGLPSMLGKLPMYAAGAVGDLFGLGMEGGRLIDRYVLGNEDAPSAEEVAGANPVIGSEDLISAYEEATGVPFYEQQTLPGQITDFAVAMVPPVPGAKLAKAGKLARAVEEASRHPTWRKAPKVGDIPKNSADLLSVRGIPVDEAVAIAEKQPHLIPGGESTRGAYVGGPPNVQNYAQLKKLRQRVYDYIAQEPRGGDWYDRYRMFLSEVTGADPLNNKTMAEMQALMSAGVDPGSELGFAMKELNGAIAGMPVKAARPMQHATVMDAATKQRLATTPQEMADATRMAKGKKTGAYASKINPDPRMSPEELVRDPNSMIGHNQGPPMKLERMKESTGVNDFRYGRTWEYTEPSGEPLKGALQQSQHKFIDYETTLMVDAANRHNLGGRSNWTGEQLQAAPWVRQKAEDFMSRRPSLTYEQAIDEATKTIADFAGKHTLSATHEARPGRGLGYLPELDKATDAEIENFSLDPRRSWAKAPGGRDAIYAGTGIPNIGGASPTGRTGFNMRVRPTIENQGMFTPEGMPTEFNRGEVARPMVGIQTTGGKKEIEAGSKALVVAAERLRALVDVQHASAAHMPFVGGKVKDSGAWQIPMDRKLTQNEIGDLQVVARRYGFDDVVDRGEGVTITSFQHAPSGPPALTGKRMKDFIAEVKQILPGRNPARAYTDGVYETMTDEFLAGNGAASQKFLDSLVTPEIREAFDHNPELAQVMLNKVSADGELMQARGMGHNYAGSFEQKVETMRNIVGSGPGWVARLEDAVKKGVVPSVLAGALFASMLAGPQGRDQTTDGS